MEDEVTLQPVDHDPFVDPMSGATVPQLQAGGQGVINAGYQFASLPKRLTQASEDLRATAGSDNPQYDPGPAFELMQTMAGVAGPAAMLGEGATLGAAGGRAALKGVQDARGTGSAIQEIGSGARAAQGGPETAGLGTSDLGGQEVNAAAAPGAARRPGGVGGIDLQPTDPQTFQQAIAAAKAAHPQGSSVTLYPDYSGMKTFLTPDGKAGFALNGNDIVSVFRHPDGPRGVTGPILDKAVSEGGQRLDAFDTQLPHLYGDHGFKAVGRTPFNDEFAPEGWDVNQYKHYNNGKPDVVAMIHDPEYGKPYANGDGKMHADYDSMIAAQKDAAFRESPLGNAPYKQYANEYPPVGPGELRQDPGSSRPYMGKELTPEAEAFQAKRAKIIDDMEKNGYQPYFDESKRFHVDPENYPAMLDTAQNLPAKQETLDKWTQMFDTPETRALLQKAYKAGQTIPNAQNWYAMGQLEREYVKQLGVDAGRKAFRENFAGAMAATTGGADPTSNFLMAHYGNFMRERGQDFPRVTPEENQQVKEYSESLGRPYVDKKGQPIDKTGDIASYKLPFPIGGQYAAGNLNQYSKVFNAVDQGKDIASALEEANPKRLDFMQAYTGNPESFVLDNQGTSYITGGKYQMPPKGSYGVLERIAREEALKAPPPYPKNVVEPRDFQDVGWAGIKKMKEGSTDEDYAGPMIGHVNRAIERTHRLTGVPRQTILRQGIIQSRMPVYGIGGLISAPAISAAISRRQNEEQ